PCAVCRVADSLWTWACEAQHCVRREPRGDRISLATCRMMCGAVPLWPRPTGVADFGLQSVPFRLLVLRLEVRSSQVRRLLEQAFDVFRGNLESLVPDSSTEDPGGRSLSEFVVSVEVYSADRDPLLTLGTNESYLLVVRHTGAGKLRADVRAQTFFGARHGLETLSQLVWWDDSTLRVLTSAHIRDAPSFPHRGVLLDTGRNFLPLRALRAAVDGLAASKLNALHWHISDSHSFPFDSPHVPSMVRHGAYSPDETYSTRDVADLVAYARVRGVRILVEVDAPAHAGNGWQWGRNLSLCLNRQPWNVFCEEPPCGQLNPDSERVYSVLGNLYLDLVYLTNVTDMFHVGGDEVNLHCWAIELGGQIAHQELMANAVVLWSSQITSSHYAHMYLEPRVYVIQTWSASSGQELLQAGYRVILSHRDVWNLGCGFGFGNIHGACAAVASWQTVYQHRPWSELELRALVLGGEACLWGETVDEHSLDARLWPRASAFGERMWTDPEGDDLTLREAHGRLAVQRERLVARGIRADALWPQWCDQNPDDCLEPLETS
ncbi:putative beta-hexosaminidase fdl, partial [Zootermopsis nevadensis]